MNLRPFQRTFIRRAMDPEILTAALCLSRGNGKSWLSGYLASQILDPESPYFRPGTESVLMAASLEQGRIVFRFAREILDDDPAYKFSDSYVRSAITHIATRTSIRLISSNAKGAMGLVRCPYVLADEPGSWEVTGGTLMHDAIQTAMGKPGSPLKALYTGTLAPSTGGWWHDLVAEGSGDGVYVQSLQGDPKRWDQWPEIRKTNPLTGISADFRKQLLRERNAARRDSRLKARFLSFRLNVPTADESQILLTVEDWKRALSREVPEREGKPIIGIDLGGGRAWSAAAAIWENGRCESLAVAPGIPSLAEQEKRDKVPRGTYQRIRNLGIAGGKRVPPVGLIVREIYERWGRPARIICDRFRLAELQDEIGPSGPFIEARQTRWSEASEDIRALRKMTKDGPLSVERESRSILQASLSVAFIKNDDQGSFRLVKKSGDNCARDDAAAALLLAAGGWDRASRKSGTTTPAFESSIVG